MRPLVLVYTADGVRFVAIADSDAEPTRQLAEYVECHASEQLWPADARHVSGLLRKGHQGEAVDYYFRKVGARWDEEWLTRAVISRESA